MEAIKTYIDNVFTAFPQTERVKTLKREMLASMEEKYHTLKSEGKSEHEAIGSVIANFGNIDEIAAELGIEEKPATAEDSISLSRDEVNSFLAQTKKSSAWIGLGIWLTLAGVCAMLFINSLSGDNSIITAAGIFVLLLAVAGAVPIFIVHGLRLEQFELYEKQQVNLDMQTRAELEQQSARYTPRFIAQISCGVVLILMAVGALILLATAGFSLLGVVILLFTIGFSAFLFTTGAMHYSVYAVLLGKEEYRYKLSNKKAERIIATVASVYWPLIVAAYLLWSFLGNADPFGIQARHFPDIPFFESGRGSWGISWILWPAAGILFGAFAGGISTWFYTKEK